MQALDTACCGTKLGDERKLASFPNGQTRCEAGAQSHGPGEEPGRQTAEGMSYLLSLRCSRSGSQTALDYPPVRR